MFSRATVRLSHIWLIDAILFFLSVVRVGLDLARGGLNPKMEKHALISTEIFLVTCTFFLSYLFTTYH
jgi:hypothetical protein